MARTVVADTNGLMAPFQFGFNLDEELGRLLEDYEVVVPVPVVRELEILARRRREAKAALSLVSRWDLVESPFEPDEAVIQVAMERGGVILTNDRALIARAKDVGIPVIRVRGGARLDFANWSGT